MSGSVQQSREVHDDHPPLPSSPQGRLVDTGLGTFEGFPTREELLAQREEG
jgi:hypothetical protein